MWYLLVAGFIVGLYLYCMEHNGTTCVYCGRPNHKCHCFDTDEHHYH